MINLIQFVVSFFQSSGDSAIHLTLGSGIFAILAHIGYHELVLKRRNNSSPTCCAAEQLEYWDRMEKKVTEPIVAALNEVKQTMRESRARSSPAD
jgi:hypothetical protein